MPRPKTEKHMVRKGGAAEASWRKFAENASIHLLIVLIITTIAYSNTFRNGFVYDDTDFIVNWGLPQRPDSIPALLAGALPPGHEGVYRPLRGAFYAISYALWAGKPFGYHLQSLMVHLVSSCLAYLIAARLTGKLVIGLLASCLFALHPVHTEAVTFMTTSFDMIGAAFFFASFYLYTLDLPIGRRQGIVMAASIIFAAIAFYTYELTLTLPVMMAAYDALFRHPIKRNAAGRMARLAPYLVCAASYLCIRFLILDIRGRNSLYAGGMIPTIAVAAEALGRYMQLMAAPINLTVEHVLPWGIFAHISATDTKALLSLSIFHVSVLAPIAVCTVLLAVAVRIRQKNPAASFGIFWFFAGLLPVSNVMPLAMVVAERYAYISSFGFCLAFAIFLHEAFIRLGRTQDAMRGVALVSVIILFAFGSATYMRNIDWESEVSLWESTVEVSPSSPLAHVNLGYAYLSRGRIAESITESRTAIMLNDNIAQAHSNLCNALGRQGSYKEAEAECRMGLDIEPGNAQIRGNLGNVLAQAGKLDEAAQSLKEAVSMNPALAQPHNDLGRVYLMQGNTEDALKEFEAALAINPSMPEANANLGNLYARAGKLELAESYLRRAIEANPKIASVHSDLGSVYLQEGRKDLARSEYNTALSIDPDLGVARKNLDRLRGG